MNEIAVKERTVLDEAMDLATLDYSYSKEHLDSLLNVRRVMFPIEQKAADALEEKIKSARRDVHQSLLGLPKMSLEPLSWRHSSGLPKIVPMALGGPEFSIGASRLEWGSASGFVEPQLPVPLFKCFRDVMEKAAEYCYRPRSRAVYSFEFEGMVPDSTRIKIGEAIKSRHFDNIFLLVETPDKAWRFTRTKGITRRQAVREAMANLSIDPIVVGFAHDALWVIDKFDLTDVEQYVLDEFSQLALPSGE